MRFVCNSYMKIWEVRPGRKEGWTDIRFSTSEKDKDGKYQQDMGDWASLWHGKDGNACAGLEAGDSIKPGAQGKLTNRYDKEKGKTFYNFTLFEFEVAKNNQSSQPAASEAPVEFNDIGAEDDIPYFAGF